MPYPPILRDRNGDPIPVVWDDAAQTWRPVRGTQYGQQVQLLGPNGQPISSSNPLAVQLNGRNVNYQTVLARAVRSAATSATIIPPGGAIGCNLYLHIHAVTGTFQSGQGISFGLFNVSPLSGAAGILGASTTKTTSAGVAHIITWYPGASKGDGSLGGSARDFKVVGLPLAKRMYVVVDITGTFNANEGFDCQVDVEYLF